MSYYRKRRPRRYARNTAPSTRRHVTYDEVNASMQWETTGKIGLPYKAVPSQLFWETWRYNKNGARGYGYYPCRDEHGKWWVAVAKATPLHDAIDALFNEQSDAATFQMAHNFNYLKG